MNSHNKAHLEKMRKRSTQALIWPNLISLVRHGQSAGNVARESAELAGLSMIDIALRDVDVPLSDLGVRQATALGDWMAAQVSGEQPTVVLASPYVRAQETARLIIESIGKSGYSPSLILDERLREREFGIVDRLTKKGINEKFPYEAQLHARLGKFYYRPPGGESWCDVILRLRSVLDTLARDFHGQRVMIVCHTVVVLCFRYLFERLSEEEILKIDRENDVANCSLTTYKNRSESNVNLGDGNDLLLEKFNFVAPLEAAGETVTRRPDKPKNEIS